jgi:hypothetical protein
MLTQTQFRQLMEIIDLHYVIIVSGILGPDMLSDFERRTLKEASVTIEDIANTPFIEMSKWVISPTELTNKKDANRYIQFKSFLSSGNELTINPIKKTLIEIAQKHTSSVLKGLGYNKNYQTGQLLNEEELVQFVKYEKIITEETVKNIQNNGSISNLASNLGHRIGYWVFDFGKISDYLMTMVFEEGRAAQMKENYGEDSKVFKRVFQKACKKCVQLYLTAGFGSEPIIYKLSELFDNGTNIERKVGEWKPVIGPTHFWCRCMLQHVDPEYDWDEKQQDFNKPKPYERKVQRKSKTKITIGDKITYV